jgi:type II secretory pathway pseudopilin PulG
MKGGRLPRGYTIVEVMLFMAISGSMFIVAGVFVNGKQASAEFRQSMNDMVVQLRSTIDDVSNGSYTLADNTFCTATAGGPLKVTTVSGAKQGQSKGCIFMGKVVQFNGPKYNVFTVAGRQFSDDTNSKLATEFGRTAGTAYQRAIASPPDPLGADLTQYNQVHFGSVATKIIDNSKGSTGLALPATCLTTNPGAIGIFGGFGSYNGNKLESGAQTVVMTCVPGSTLNQPIATTLSNIQNIVGADVYGSVNYKICFDGGHSNKASITIGGANGQQLAVTLKVEDPVC